MTSCEIKGSLVRDSLLLQENITFVLQQAVEVRIVFRQTPGLHRKQLIFMSRTGLLSSVSLNSCVKDMVDMEKWYRRQIRERNGRLSIQDLRTQERFVSNKNHPEWKGGPCFFLPRNKWSLRDDIYLIYDMDIYIYTFKPPILKGQESVVFLLPCSQLKKVDKTMVFFLVCFSWRFF